ncbi:MAG: 50S ribosomal protein L13 [Deltaproteobacteria bacterium]|nr:50S ribosomal protein L13 [Deltaproteobacteria bacterium]
MKTCKITPADLDKKWVTVDATGQTLGRLASEIARILRGKHKPTFVPHLDCGDNVVVTNAAKMVLTGRKLEQKNYYHHSGYIGGIKETSAAELMEKHPERLLEFAVKGMLPKSKLGRQIYMNMKVYAGAGHKHEAQKPEVMAPRTASGE